MTLRDESDANSQQAIPEASTVKGNLVRRRLVIGSAVVGIGGVAAAAIHDGELGGPSQTYRGAVPWQEGTADAPPGASGSGYVYFTPTEVAFIEAAVARLIQMIRQPGQSKNAFFLIDNSPASSGRETIFPGGLWPKGTPEQGYQTGFTPATVSRCHGSDR